MAATIEYPKFDEPSFVTIELTCDAAAAKVEVGFNPRKVEVIAKKLAIWLFALKALRKPLN